MQQREEKKNSEIHPMNNNKSVTAGLIFLLRKNVFLSVCLFIMWDEKWCLQNTWLNSKYSYPVGKKEKRSHDISLPYPNWLLDTSNTIIFQLSQCLFSFMKNHMVVMPAFYRTCISQNYSFYNIAKFPI